MERRLYGFDALLDELVPLLVGREPGGGVCDFAFPEGNPVLEVVGGRDTGKSAFLGALFESYKDWLPLARADFADSGYGEPALAAGVNAQDAPNASPVSNLLYLLSHKLGLYARAFQRPMRFPRLQLGLLVVTAWYPDGDGLPPPQLLRKQEEVRQFLAQDHPDPKRLRRLLLQWIDAVLAHLGAVVPGLPGIDAIVAGTLETVRGEVSTGPDKGVVSWWKAQLPAYLGDGLQRLFDSVWDFRRGGETRRETEGRLVAAFLADIAQHYGPFKRWNQAARPLLLLDNAHAAAGEAFLDLMCSAYGAGVGGTERPAVVVTKLGHGLHHAPPCGKAEDLPEQWPKVVLGIRDVTGTDIRTMLTATPNYPADLPLFVDRFSGGRTGSAVLLCEEAVRIGRGGEPVDGTGLVDVVAPRLLERLVPDKEFHEPLMLLAAARDEAAAMRLWRVFHPDDDAAARVEQAMDYLAAAHLTGDRALEKLLLHQLARDPRWERIHLNLRAGHNPNQLAEYAAGHTDDYLHHTLSLGRVEPVVHAMHRRFADTSAGQWLASANRLCSAPRPREAPAPDTSAPACPACPGDGSPDEVHWAIRRLLRTVWDLSEPLCFTPDQDRLNTVGAELENLHRAERSEDTTYRRAERTWPKQLESHVQAPDLEIPEASRS